MSHELERENGRPERVQIDTALARMIDHTLLKSDAAADQVKRLCREALEYQFATVCVNPYWVRTAVNELSGSNVGVTTVVGFPLGASSTFTKVAETRDAIAAGATDIDMVMNIGALKTGDSDEVRRDIEAVVNACRGRAVVKVILEICYLTEVEIDTACAIAVNAGTDFVKTSTGFGSGGATVEAVERMRRAVGATIGVKASGGIRDEAAARRMIAAGATRIGASTSIAIVSGGTGQA